MIVNTTIPLLLIVFVLVIGSIIAGKIIARTGASVLACRAVMGPLVALASVMVPPIHRAIAPHDMSLNNWTIYYISVVALFAVMYKPAAWVLVPEFPAPHMPTISRPKLSWPKKRRGNRYDIKSDPLYPEFVRDMKKARR